MKTHQTNVSHRSAILSPSSPIHHPAPAGTLTEAEIRQIIQEMMG